MTKDLKEVVQLARKMEMDGSEFYGKAAEKAVNPQAKRLFESFAADERRHLGIVESMARGVGVDVEKMPMPRATVRTVFTSAQAGSRAGAVAAGEREAVQDALSLERQSYRLYKHAATAGQGAQRALLERLASEENEHYEMLENTLEYLEDNQKWFLFREWGLLTGDMSSLGT